LETRAFLSFWCFGLWRSWFSFFNFYLWTKKIIEFKYFNSSLGKTDYLIGRKINGLNKKLGGTK
jgi:hypothetical protein